MATSQSMEDQISEWLGVGAEMIARVFGDVPMWVVASPAVGTIVITGSVIGMVGSFQISAVQCEDLLRKLARAKDIVEGGVGQMR